MKWIGDPKKQQFFYLVKVIMNESSTNKLVPSPMLLIKEGGFYPLPVLLRVDQL